MRFFIILYKVAFRKEEKKKKVKDLFSSFDAHWQMKYTRIDIHKIRY